MRNPNDISIGKDAWITFADLDQSQTESIDMDEILTPVEPFFTMLESHCVAECCGIDAYALWPSDIALAAKRMDIQELRSNFREVYLRLAATEGVNFVSRRMNNHFHRTTLVKLLDHISYWIANIDRAGESSE